MARPNLDWNVWRVRLGYGAFAVLAFALALRWTFPSDALRERIVAEAAARGYTVNVQKAGLGGGLLGVRAEGITVDDGTGLKFPVDSASVALRVLPLLTGRRSVAFDVELWDGRVRGTADVSGDERAVTVALEGLDLARAIPLRRASGLDLVGKVTGAADLVVPATPQGKLGGRADAKVTGAGVSGGKVPVPGMEGGIPVPKLSLGDVVADVKIDQGKATFQKLEAKGGDAEASAEDLFLVVQPRLKDSPISGRARLKIRDAFWAQGNMAGLRGLAEAAMAGAKSGDAYVYQLSGSLARPAARPAR
ncbi:MAG: type II secretion system protein GspN [Anaeromyxobacter sp.]